MRKIIYILLFLTLPLMVMGQWSTSPDSALPLELRDGDVNFYDTIFLNNSTLIASWNLGVSMQARIYIQNLTMDGVRLFGPEGLRLCHNVESWQTITRCASDTTRGCFVTWRDDRSGDFDIYGQHLNSAGEFLWDSAGVALVEMTGNQVQSICPDGAGGFYLGWVTGTGSGPVHACRYDGEGNPYWDYLSICNFDANVCTGLAPDGEGGAIILWYNDFYEILYGQRVTAEGEILWTPNGHFIANDIGYPANYNSSFHSVISDGRGGALFRSDACMLRVSPDGDVLWTQTYAVSWPGYALSQQIELTPSGKIYASVNTSGTGWNDVFLSCLNLNGEYIWENLNFTNENYESVLPCFTLNSKGIEIIFYYGLDIQDALYSQAVDSLGNCLWRWGGVPVYHTEESCVVGKVCSDLSDGAIGIIPAKISYTAQNFDSLYASRILSDGTLGYLPVIGDLTVGLRESGVELRWGAVSGALMYNIFTSLEAGSFPAEPDTSVADTVYIDRGAINEGKKFYRVSYTK